MVHEIDVEVGVFLQNEIAVGRALVVERIVRHRREGLALGRGYTISGTQLNGLSQAVSYGDDAQTATNYPIVQLSNAEGDVKYLPTSNFSTMVQRSARSIR